MLGQWEWEPRKQKNYLTFKKQELQVICLHSQLFGKFLRTAISWLQLFGFVEHIPLDIFLYNLNIIQHRKRLLNNGITTQLN